MLSRAQAWCSCTKTPYFRVNPLLSEVIALDETSDVEICNALWETKAYMHAMRKEVDLLIELMLTGQITTIDIDKVVNDRTNIDLTISVSQNDIKIESKNAAQRQGSDRSDRQTH